jgi:Uma2 family endonuclease
MTVTNFSGEIIATGVTFEEYLAQYAEDFCEFVGGAIIKMNPVSLRHDRLVYYIRTLVEIYFVIKPIGTIIGAPVPMRLPTSDHGREPDLQIILNENADRLGATHMEGPADICIEVVSPESVSRDHGEKFEEYEKGGVGEYWIIDPVHQEARFYRLNDKGLYEPQTLNESGDYITPTLPQFRLHVTTLWEDNLPDPLAIAELVREMLNEGAG